ncbi:MAG TPA: Crp/Fnr family transcriptional regulator [Chitinophagaceae bacterium]|nr:Crp/Fnr family transcriptional regulator [Chitinophagaceae bacterium]
MDKNFLRNLISMQSLYEYIRQYANVTQEEFERIAKLLETVECGKKHILTQKGQVEKYLYIINRGLVRKFFYKNKEEVITQIAKEKDLVCSSVSFLSQKPSEYVVETLEPCTLFALSYENLQKMYSWGHHMNRLGRLITLDWLLQKEIWEHERLRHEPRDRFIRFMNENSELVQRVQQKYLASYLNMKPETFSRYKHLLRG